jgi:diguanylate cyclase (GGDEF)-like protein
MRWIGNQDADEMSTEGLRQLLYGSQIAAALVLVAAALVRDPYATTALTAACVLVACQFVISRLLGRKSQLQLRERQSLLEDARGARLQIEELFAMTDMLQSAESHEDAGAVLEATSRRLLPGLMGALYIFNNSRDRLDLAVTWAESGAFDPSATLMPANCWALKRGKAHVNDPGAATLCCTHHTGGATVLELPMVARGTVYGLLMLATSGGRSQLEGVTRIGRALTDSMSLALSNIALREKLRTQSLRDPLTGLYNRRYMEDALERFVSMAERNGKPTAAIMIDLDHFKKVNDLHGHAKGDAVLRDVAGQLVSALRPSDVVCRYGGEELLVILPECGLDDALGKAEALRARIASLSDLHGASVSASLGVAAVPCTSSGVADLLPMADAALYQAKQSGRNCVRAADRRQVKDKPRLATG